MIFENEEYLDRNGRQDSLTANIPDSDTRNEIIWGLDQRVEIITNQRGIMPHWRVLEVICGDFQLNIYPNGGFANGWFISRNNSIYHQFDNTNIETEILLINNEEIMFDVEMIS